MKSYLFILPAFIILFLPACKQKKKETGKHYISVPSLLKEQVAHIDTSLYMIVKYVTDDSMHTDTSYIKREDFGKEAVDFLKIPDLSDPKLAKKFKEEPAVMDETLNRVIIEYTPIDASTDLKKLQLLISPTEPEGENVRSIIASFVTSDRDHYLKKELLWQMDKSFTVVTTTQLIGQPEKNITTKVSWNEDKDQ